MPYTGGSTHNNSNSYGCSCHVYQDADAHLLNDCSFQSIGSGHSGAGGAPTRFCPGQTKPRYAPDLLLQPIHFDLTLHVDLEQQCLVMDQLIEVRCNISSKSNIYTIHLDGIGFQHLHASRVVVKSEEPKPLDVSQTPKISVNSGELKGDAGFFSGLFGKKHKRLSQPPSSDSRKSVDLSSSSTKSDRSEKKSTESKPESKHNHLLPKLDTSTLDSSRADSPSPAATPINNTAFYCTYDGRRITLTWMGSDAFNGGAPGAIEVVRLIYLVEKPITGLSFTKPATAAEVEAIDQQQRPLVSSSFMQPPDAEQSKEKSTTKEKKSSKSSNQVLSPFHASRPLLAATDHETERARYWLACIDQPNVRATYKYTFVVRAGLTALANGELLAPSNEAPPAWPLSLLNPPVPKPAAPSYGRTVYVWDNPYPTASYLVCWAVGQLQYTEAIPPRSITETEAPKAAKSHKRTLSVDASSSSVSSTGGRARAETLDQGGYLRRNRSTELDSIMEDELTASTASSSGISPSSVRSSNYGTEFPSYVQYHSRGFSSETNLQFIEDQNHHKKSAKHREEASFVLTDIPMRYYTPRNVPLSTLQLMLSKTPEIMKWLQGRLGLPFPFPLKYYQFVAPELPSAMENITLTTWGNEYLLNPIWAQEYGPTVESINVHEMAHSYFGNSIGIKFWDQAWLKEGWANYAECLWQEDKYGNDALSYMLHRNGKLYMKESDKLYHRPIVTKLYDSSWDLYDQHLYRGASRRIHTLRCMLGDDIFWPAVTDYLRTFSGKLVETDDFRKVLEKHSHRNLIPFFDQWFHSPGYPKVYATFEYSSHRQQVTINAKQTQMEEGGVPTGVGIFDMAIPIEIAYLVSSTSTSKIKWVKADLVFSEGSAEAHLTISLPSPPLQVVVDRNQSYCFTLDMYPGFSILRTMVFHCNSVAHRIWAANMLLTQGNPQEIEVIAELLLHREKHWGVIADVSVALAKQHRASHAASILCKLLLAPRNHPAQQPRALMSVALALGQIRDSRIAGAIRQFLATRHNTSLVEIDADSIKSVNSTTALNELELQAINAHSGKPDAEPVESIPYKTHSRLLEALASQYAGPQAALASAKSDEALLVEQAERSRYGWLGITRSGALLALAKLATPSAFEYILESTRISQHQHMLARCGAISALAACVYNSKMIPTFLSRAIYTLQLLLHDPVYQIRIESVHAILRLVPAMPQATASESLRLIRHIRKSLSNQDRMWLKRKLLLQSGVPQAQHAATNQATAVPLAGSAAVPMGLNASVMMSTQPQVTKDEFMALKAEVQSLKTRLTNLESQLTDSENE